jgi:hypothetical protein
MEGNFGVGEEDVPQGALMEFKSSLGQRFPRWRGLKQPRVGCFPNGKLEIAKVGIDLRKDLVARSKVVGRWGKKRIGGKVWERAQGRLSHASSWVK